MSFILNPVGRSAIRLSSQTAPLAGRLHLQLVRAATTSTTSASTAKKPASSATATKATSTTSKTSTSSAASKPSSSSAPPSAADFTSAAPSSASSSSEPFPSLNDFSDLAPNGEDWSRSFNGLSTEPFPAEIRKILLEPVPDDDIEIKPDGIIYLPEIKYRRILNTAFGPGGWGLAPRGETIVTDKLVTREYALICHGRLVSIARGEQQYFDAQGIPTATEGCKSNALMRCCKDLGIASQLWDPRYIRRWKKEFAKQVWVSEVGGRFRKKKMWLRKEDAPPDGWKEG